MKTTSNVIKTCPLCEKEYSLKPDEIEKIIQSIPRIEEL